MTDNLADAVALEAADTLVPHPQNPRQGDVGVIVESIRTNGFYAPLVVQRSTRHVLAGNHRLLAARRLGMEQVPVVWVDVDDERALRILLADNRTSDLGAYDDQALAALLTDIAQQTEAGLVGTGWDDGALDDLLAVLGPGLFEPKSDADALGDVHDHLGMVELKLRVPEEVAQRFRALPGEDDVARFLALLP